MYESSIQACQLRRTKLPPHDPICDRYLVVSFHVEIDHFQGVLGVTTQELIFHLLIKIFAKISLDREKITIKLLNRRLFFCPVRGEEGLSNAAQQRRHYPPKAISDHHPSSLNGQLYRNSLGNFNIDETDKQSIVRC
jgi:hypothetical protein